ncbi:P-loop containing nucleoside triphosphate hydrolase protein [Cadophora sp. DSE1049]|nr:P-loop containing nucleoside triphosphate hydrolase protein [Cadophora sp. DSE1049]
MNVCGDDSFGPGVQSSNCRGGFDFTVSFEESILTILPAACFIIFTPLRAIRLFKRRIKVKSTVIHAIKLVAIGTYAVLQLALIILWSSSHVYFKTRLSVASTVLNLLAALGLGLLSHLEHVKAIRPSFVIAAYLFVSLIFDIARVRTQWLLPTNDPIAAVLTAAVVTKVLMLLLETLGKRRFLLAAYRGLSPEITSGLFSRGFFWWLNSLLANGFKNVLSADDIFPINENLSSRKLSDDLQSRWDACDQKNRNALMRQAIIGFRWRILSIVFPRLCVVGLSVAQPFLVNEAIKFVQSVDGNENVNIGYGLIGAYTFVYIGNAVATGWYQHLSYRLMAMVRGGLIGMIYQKITTLKSANINDSAAMTLMGTDVEQIAENLHLIITDLWANILQIGIAIYLLERQVGAVCIAPVILAIVSTLVTSKFSSFVTMRQKVWLEAIQQRVNFTSETLGSMKSVKMLGLTDKLGSIMQAMRERELRLSKKFRRLSSGLTLIYNFPHVFTQFFTLSAYAIVAKIQGSTALTVEMAVTTLSILTILDHPLSMFLLALPKVYVSSGCFQRIQEFLLEEPRIDQRALGSDDSSDGRVFPLNRTSSSGDIELMPPSAPKTLAHSRIVSWNDQVFIKAGDFGWTSTNSATINNATLQLPSHARLTMIVGSIGCGKSTLLKGILGETSIARGLVYARSEEIAFSEQTPWLINGTIRENVIAESSYEEGWYDTVIRACNLDVDILHMPSRDTTLVGSKGITLSGGQKQRLSIARAVYSRKKLAIFDDVFSGLDTVTEQHVFAGVFGKDGLLAQLGTTIILATHGVHRLSEADHIVVLGKNGQILEQGSYNGLAISQDYVQSLAKSQESKETDKIAEPHSQAREQPTRPLPQVGTTDSSRQTGDWKIYVYYSKSLGLLGLAGFSILVAVEYLWVTWWAADSQRHPSSKLGYWIGLYALWSFLVAIFMSLAVFYLYVVLAAKSSNKLHHIILKAAMRAPMAFYAATETGELVNRFSQDMRLVDMTLPGALINVFFQIGSTIGTMSLVIAAVGYFAAALPFIFGVLYLVQRFYLRTSRQLRLLEIETKAPIFSHFMETLSGLVTIRAFGWTEAYKNKNLRLVDASQKPYYLLLCIQRWLTLVLDLIVAGIAILLIILAVFLRHNISPGLLGIALVQVTSLGQTLANLIMQWTTLETSLGAVARIKSFSEDTPSELLAGENEVPDAQWPARGHLTFEGVSASYGSHTAPVLNDINMSILPGQKIGICGRTGSGKSSFISSILRMVELSSGKITLDNHDLSTISRPLIRQRLICLTQDPFLFTGSIRLNADPLGEADDSEIVTAMQKVGLWDVIAAKIEGGKEADIVALDAVMDENFLSHGQRQLFCLARAMLRRSSVLILDEPTSSVDVKTDAQMQKVIRSEFKNHTIIMIAHRLNSLLDFDRVAVLNKGNLVEFGEPSVLLEKDGSAFSKLYHASS